MTVDIQKKPSSFSPLRLFKFDTPLPPVVKVAAGTAVSVLSGVGYLNWSVYEQVLLKQGAFFSHCDGSDVYAVDGMPDVFTCGKQLSATSNIGAVIFAVQLLFSFVAGTLTDTLCPKFVSILGLTLQLFGYGILFGSTPKVPLYLLGGILIGIGADTSFLPIFALTRFYPNAQNTVISCAGTGRSVSFAIPLILSAIVSATKMDAMFVFGVGHIILTVISMILILISVPSTTSSEYAQLSKDSEDPTQQEKPTLKESIKYVLSECKSAKLLLFLPYIILNYYRVIFLNTPVSSYLNSSALKQYQFWGTFSFVPCPLLGMAVDKFSIFPVIQSLNISAILATVCALLKLSDIGNPYVQYIFIVVMNYHMSFFTSQVYCYANSVFQQEYVSIFIGLFCTIGGLATFCVPPSLAYAYVKGFKTILSSLIVGGVIAGILATVLWVKYGGKRTTKSS